MPDTENNYFDMWSLNSNTTFVDWVNHYNSLVVDKLNRLHVYEGAAGDGIDFQIGTSGGNSGEATHGGGTMAPGTIRFSLADVLPNGVTFAGDVTIQGDLNYDLSNAALSSIKTRVFPDADGIYGMTSDSHLGAGYTLGTPVRVTDTGGITSSFGDSRDNAEVWGLVSGLTYASATNDSLNTIANTWLEITTHGKIDGDFNHATHAPAGKGLTSGCVFFLSPGPSAGHLTQIEPVIVGQVSKPVLMGLSADSGVILQYRGQYLQGSGTGGTGGIDNNQIMVVVESGSSIERGDVVGYDTTVSKWVTVDESFGVGLEHALGLCTVAPFALDGVDYIKIVGSGYIDDMPEVTGTGLLYVGADGQLTSDVSTGKPFAISWTSGKGFIINQNYGGGGGGGANTAQSTYGSPASWAYRSSNIGGTTFGHAINDNILINGNFDVWQRGIGVGTAYGSTGSTYFADRWMRIDGVSGAATGTYSIARNTFATNQTDVFGSPNYYTTFQNSLTPQGGICGDINRDYVRIMNRVEDVRTLRNEIVTMSFWAKCGVTGSTMDIVVEQYDGSSTGVTHPAAVELGTLWNKYEVAFTVPDITTTPSGKDYVAFGFDTSNLNTTLDLAKVKLERGLVATANPKSDENEELIKSSRYYQRTYNTDQTTGTATMFDVAIPDNTVLDFHITPKKDFYHRFPVKMRANPTVNLYSPKSGITGDAYNRSSGRDLKLSSGTRGYNNESRVVVAGTDTISAENITRDGIYLFVPRGTVLFDNVSVHYVADSDLDDNTKPEFNGFLS